MTIADDLEEAYANDDEIIELVRKTRREKLTNIGRFFSSDVLADLHFELKIDNGSTLRPRTLLVRHSSEQLRDFFAWAIAYIFDNSVDAYKNPDVRKEALRKASHLLPSLADASDEPFRLAERPSLTEDDGDPEPVDEDDTPGPAAPPGGGTAKPGGRYGSGGNSAGAGADGNGSGSSAPAGGGQGSQQGKKREVKPERYLLQTLRLPKHPERVQHLLKECRSLEINESPGIACVMLRVLVELSVSTPQVLALSGEVEASPLRKKITSMLKYLDPDIEHPIKRDKELAQAFLEASDLGVQYLNGFVHNPKMRPDQHLARRFSSAFRPFLERVEGAL